MYKRQIQEGVQAPDYDHPLAGLHIVVDAGNGAGGFYAWDVLEPLGADISGSQFLEPDGMFPNHIPNPENETAMASICQAVKASGADLGVIFDTDVDRAGAVDKNGREINRNRIIALISAILLQEHPGTAIVTDSITSSGLKAFIEGKGLSLIHISAEEEDDQNDDPRAAATETVTITTTHTNFLLEQALPA